MTIFSRRPADDADARALNDYLDDLTSGVLAPRDGIEPDIAAVVSQLQQVGHRTAEPPGLRTQLWEDLMNTATPLESGSFATPIPRKPPSPDVPARLKALPRAIITRPRHTLELIAAAIILLGLVGASLIGRGDGGSDPTPESAALAPFFGSATPTLEEQMPCITLPNPYYTCQNAIRDLGINTVWPTDQLTNGEYQVQLQGWAITPGKSLTGAKTDAADGMVVDFVINGSYSATFDVPVVVSPGGITNDPIQYLDPGTSVELVRGDSVSYQLGGLVELHNPLTEQRLEFKRGVIYDGDISAFSATTNGVTTRAEGDAVLPATTDSKPRQQLTITLDFVQILPGVPFPPSQMQALTIVGPTDPQRGPEGTEGFVLAIRATQG